MYCFFIEGIDMQDIETRDRVLVTIIGIILIIFFLLACNGGLEKAHAAGYDTPPIKYQNTISDGVQAACIGGSAAITSAAIGAGTITGLKAGVVKGALTGVAAGAGGHAALFAAIVIIGADGGALQNVKEIFSPASGYNYPTRLPDTRQSSILSIFVSPFSVATLIVILVFIYFFYPIINHNVRVAITNRLPSVFIDDSTGEWTILFSKYNLCIFFMMVLIIIISIFVIIHPYLKRAATNSKSTSGIIATFTRAKPIINMYGIFLLSITIYLVIIFLFFNYIPANVISIVDGLPEYKDMPFYLVKGTANILEIYNILTSIMFFLASIIFFSGIVVILKLFFSPYVGIVVENVSPKKGVFNMSKFILFRVSEYSKWVLFISTCILACCVFFLTINYIPQDLGVACDTLLATKETF